MSHYYHAKLVLCDRCDIVGARAVSVIIRGLPAELQANAYAAKCGTPTDLYSNFLVGLEHYKPAEAISYAAVARPSKRTFGGASETLKRPKPIEVASQSRLRCYNCQEFGTHLSHDCPQARVERCSICKRGGHVVSTCIEARR
jgi:hypothetical protein